MTMLKWLVAVTTSLLVVTVEGASSAPDNVSSRLMIHVRKEELKSHSPSVSDNDVLQDWFGPAVLA
jgi:hypothetical protein